MALLKEVSIEYAHIYTNNKIGEEHALSLKILGEVKGDRANSSLVVMVDDYSFPDASFDYEEFSGWLTKSGFAPDIMIRESVLIPLCDEVLVLVESPKLKEEITDYIKTKKYPCSLFIAAWYLIRLGCLPVSFFREEFAAKKLLNILPLSFKPFEDKALEIISSTKFRDRVDDIEYKFFEGRMIA
jgi:hypothetical protein